jgi:hypothetical protein
MFKVESTTTMMIAGKAVVFAMIVDGNGRAGEIAFESVEAAQGWVDAMNGLTS